MIDKHYRESAGNWNYSSRGKKAFYIHKRKEKRFFHNLYMFTAISIALAALIYMFHDYFTPILNSQGLCKNTVFIGVSNWLLPKAVVHCDLITNTDLGLHSKSSIAVPIVVFVSLYCVASFFFVLNHLIKMNRNDLAYVRDKMANITGRLNLVIWWPIIFFGAYLGYSAYIDVFFDGPLQIVNQSPAGGIGRLFEYRATFSSIYGIGPMLQIVYAFAANLFLYIVISDALALLFRSDKQ